MLTDEKELVAHVVGYLVKLDFPDQFTFLNKMASTELNLSNHKRLSQMGRGL